MAGMAGGGGDDALRRQARRVRSFDAVGEQEPAAPSKGATWYDTGARGGRGECKVWDGSRWRGSLLLIAGLPVGLGRFKGQGGLGGGA